jgi:RNA polymerase sigma-70 factor (sigma-E family)
VSSEGGSLGRLYDRHIDDAVRFAYLLTGDEHLAQDLAHDAFVRLLKRFHDLRSKEAFGAYLRRTILNLVRDRYRRRLRWDRYEQASRLREAEVDQPDVGLQQDLWRALQELPHRQRAAVILRYYEDLSEAQVGEVLGCSAGSVKSLVARGMEKLREIVAEMELK